jgi:hypothetical protein
MGVLYGRAGRLAAQKNGGFRRGQSASTSPSSASASAWSSAASPRAPPRPTAGVDGGPRCHPAAPCAAPIWPLSPCERGRAEGERRHGPRTRNLTFTGLAQNSQVGPAFRMEIPVRGLKLARILGQPCAFYPRRGGAPRTAGGRGPAARAQDAGDGPAGRGRVCHVDTLAICCVTENHE